MALLQYVHDDMHLCHGVTELHPGAGDKVERVLPVNNVPHRAAADDDGAAAAAAARDANNIKNNIKKNDKIHITPTNNGIPVALLAKRGQCTYETKARIASTLTTPKGVVRFLIVYDDEMEDGEHLITMMPREGGGGGGGEEERELYEELGLVFVSYESGMGE